MLEANDLIEAHIGQTGHKRNAVGDRFDTPDLLGDRRERRRFDAAPLRRAASCQDLRGVFVTAQFLANPIKISAPAIAHNRVAAVKLDAGN